MVLGNLTGINKGHKHKNIGQISQKITPALGRGLLKL